MSPFDVRFHRGRPKRFDPAMADRHRRAQTESDRTRQGTLVAACEALTGGEQWSIQSVTWGAQSG